MNIITGYSRVFGVKKTLTFRTSVGTADNVGTYTFSNIAIGAESPDRRVIVGVGSAGASKDISGVTINGIVATPIQNVLHFGGNNICLGLFVANIPTSITADIVVTHTGAKAWQGIGVWTATGLTSDTPLASGNSTLLNPITKTLLTSNGGFCVAFAHGITTNFNWNNMNKRFDEIVDAGRQSGADASTIVNNITINCSSDTTNMGVVGATW